MAPQDPPAWAIGVFTAFALLVAGAFLGFVAGVLTTRRGQPAGPDVTVPLVEDQEPVQRIRRTGGL